MHPQLQAVVDELESAHRRLHALADMTPEDCWIRRITPSQWSVAECIAHLNLTSAGFVPLLHEGIARGRLLDGTVAGRYRRDPVGWLLWRVMGPPVRFRAKTTAPFIPAKPAAPSELIAEFARLQSEQIGCVREADGLPLGRIQITSPFNARVKYNLYACLTILSRHQHRHLWQAEQVWQSIGGAPVKSG